MGSPVWRKLKRGEHDRQWGYRRRLEHTSEVPRSTGHEMIKRSQKQKSGERGEAGESLGYITYKIVYGEPTRFIPVHITMDRDEAHVMTSKYRNETGYDYIVYEFQVQDIGDAMMTGDKAIGVSTSMR